MHFFKLPLFEYKGLMLYYILLKFVENLQKTS